jgi:hypothetical protein
VRDGDWYLGYFTYDDLPGAALYFGRMEHGIYCLSEPDVRFTDPEVGDAALPGEDGIRLGRDYQRSATVTFELGVDGVKGPVDRHYPKRPWSGGQRIGQWADGDWELVRTRVPGGPEKWAADGLAMLRQVWRADSIRMKPSRVAWLEHMVAGRRRRLYGRPRKFEVAHSRLLKQGYVPVVAEFTALDDRFYDSYESSVEMWDYWTGGYYPRPGRPWGGGTPPFASSMKRVSLNVEGHVPTYPWIVIHGPCKNPKVTISGLWSAQLAMTIPAGDTVTIDARPWMRTVLWDKGSSTASVADKLTRSSGRLGAMALPPGYWTATLSYTRSSTKYAEGPRVQIIWREAYGGW